MRVPEEIAVVAASMKCSPASSIRRAHDEDYRRIGRRTRLDWRWKRRKEPKPARSLSPPELIERKSRRKADRASGVDVAQQPIAKARSRDRAGSGTFVVVNTTSLPEVCGSTARFELI